MYRIYTKKPRTEALFIAVQEMALRGVGRAIVRFLEAGGEPAYFEITFEDGLAALAEGDREGGQHES